MEREQVAEPVASKIGVSVVDGVTIVTFTDPKVIDQRNILLIGGELTEMVLKGGVRKMIVDMSGVKYLSSAVLGKLISVHKNMRVNRGMLKLCGISKNIYEVFEITRLDRVFDIYKTKDEALEAFRAGS